MKIRADTSEIDAALGVFCPHLQGMFKMCSSKFIGFSKVLTRCGLLSFSPPVRLTAPQGELLLFLKTGGVPIGGLLHA